tara:strand:- start:56 stop:634 length:579 start_codon:yes stop_codon:yes gene_type:complete
MACTSLTKGRGVDCNRISGGVKYIYFAVLDQIASFAYDAVDLSSIDTIDFDNNSIYRYTMPMGVSSVTDTIVGSRDNGTIYYTPTAQVLYNRLTMQDQEEIRLLGATKVIIFAQLNQLIVGTNNDVILALGMVNGLELNAGTMDTGAAWGDKNGYTLTFDGMEQRPMAMLENYTTTPFDNAGFTNLTSIITS